MFNLFSQVWLYPPSFVNKSYWIWIFGSLVKGLLWPIVVNFNDICTLVECCLICDYTKSSNFYTSITLFYGIFRMHSAALWCFLFSNQVYIKYLQLNVKRIRLSLKCFVGSFQIWYWLQVTNSLVAYPLFTIYIYIYFIFEYIIWFKHDVLVICLPIYYQNVFMFKVYQMHC